MWGCLPPAVALHKAIATLQIKNTQKISREEIAAGYSDSQSWHARFKHSAYIYTGGLPYTLTDGDLLAIFAQYGEIIDVNLVRSEMLTLNSYDLTHQGNHTHN
jgi:RNA recognition motif-containing protein